MRPCSGETTAGPRPARLPPPVQETADSPGALRTGEALFGQAALADRTSLPYREHQRTADPYGYVASDGNYYWVPEKLRGKLSVIEYDNRIDISVQLGTPEDYEHRPAYEQGRFSAEADASAYQKLLHEHEDG